MRTDIHRPSTINPEDYAYVALGYVKIESLGDALVLQAEREILATHMAKTGGVWATHEHGGSCHICGASCVYTVIFHHAATNVYIRTGTDCAEKLDMGDPEKFRIFRDAVNAARKAKAGRAKAEALLKEDDLLELAWNVFIGCERAYNRPFEEETIVDIVSKLIRYGSISEPQTKFLKKLVMQIPEREALAAKRAAERAAAEPCPTGRVTVAATVLKVETRETAYGCVDKMLVKLDSGCCAWGTCPAGISSDSRGKKIQLTATFEPSKDDSKFGFFKRPKGCVA